MPHIVAISDTHGRHEGLRLPSGDILVHSGDYMRYSDVHDAARFLRWFEAQPHEHKVFIDGNHDGISEAQPEVFRTLVVEHAPSCVYLNDSGATIMGLRFWGSPVSPAFYDWHWNRERGADIQRHWDLIPDDTEVLLTHGPVAGIHDRVPEHGFTGGYEDTGCANLKATIAARLRDLRLHVCGHIHLHGGKTKVVAREGGGTIYVNASVVDESYTIKHAPVEVDL